MPSRLPSSRLTAKPPHSGQRGKQTARHRLPKVAGNLWGARREPSHTNFRLSQEIEALLVSLHGRHRRNLQPHYRSNQGPCSPRPRAARAPPGPPRLPDVQAANTASLRTRWSPLLRARLLPRPQESHPRAPAAGPARSPGTHKGKPACQGLSTPCNKHLCSGMLRKPITSRHITSFISYMRMVYFPMSTLALSIKSPPSPLFLYPSHLTL